jgi:hypothetical protein
MNFEAALAQRNRSGQPADPASDDDDPLRTS